MCQIQEISWLLLLAVQAGGLCASLGPKSEVTRGADTVFSSFRKGWEEAEAVLR